MFIRQVCLAPIFAPDGLSCFHMDLEAAEKIVLFCFFPPPPFEARIQSLSQLCKRLVKALEKKKKKNHLNLTKQKVIPGFSGHLTSSWLLKQDA